MGLSRIELYTNFDKPLTDEERSTMREWVARRGAGEPLQLICGTAPFRHMVLEVASCFFENGPTEHQVGNEEYGKREEGIGKCCLKAAESRRCERNDDDRSYEKCGANAYA